MWQKLRQQQQLDHCTLDHGNSWKRTWLLIMFWTDKKPDDFIPMPPCCMLSRKLNWAPSSLSMNPNCNVCRNFWLFLQVVVGKHASPNEVASKNVMTARNLVASQFIFCLNWVFCLKAKTKLIVMNLVASATNLKLSNCQQCMKASSLQSQLLKLHCEPHKPSEVSHQMRRARTFFQGPPCRSDNKVSPNGEMQTIFASNWWTK